MLPRLTKKPQETEKYQVRTTLRILEWFKLLRRKYKLLWHHRFRHDGSANATIPVVVGHSGS